MINGETVRAQAGREPTTGSAGCLDAGRAIREILDEVYLAASGSRAEARPSAQA